MTVVEQPSAGWRLRFSEGWQKPKPYERPEVVEHWNQQGVGHRVPAGADTHVLIGPMLIWWGDEIRKGQSLEDVAKLMAEHHGFAEKLSVGDVTDVKVAGLPAKRADVTFDRSIAFAPPGKGHGTMRATLFLIRENGQENGIWFEAPAADFARFEPELAVVVRDAEVIPRKPGAN